MKFERAWRIVSRIHDNVEMGLWATLLAAVVFFVAFDVPKLHEAHAQAEALRAEEIAAENRAYCEKWGTPTRTMNTRFVFWTFRSFAPKSNDRSPRKSFLDVLRWRLRRHLSATKF